MNLLQKQKGAILVLTAVMLPLLLAFMGLAVDLGNVFAAHAKLQSAADASVLAGAQIYVKHNDKKAASDKAETILKQNIDTSNIRYDFTPSSGKVVQRNTEYYVARLRESVPLTFLRFVGLNQYTIQAKAVARVTINDPAHREDRNNAYKLLENVLRQAVKNQQLYDDPNSWQYRWVQGHYERYNIYENLPRIALPTNKSAFIDLIVTKETGARNKRDGGRGSGNIQINGGNYTSGSALWNQIVYPLDSSLSGLEVKQQNGITWYGVRLYGDGKAIYFQGYNDSTALRVDPQGDPDEAETARRHDGHTYYRDSHNKLYYRENNRNWYQDPYNGEFENNYMPSGDSSDFNEDDTQDDTVPDKPPVLVDNSLA